MKDPSQSIDISKETIIDQDLATSKSLGGSSENLEKNRLKAFNVCTIK